VTTPSPSSAASISLPLISCGGKPLGHRLENVTPTLLLAVSDLRADPCKIRLHRAASAARYAASIAEEPLKTEAVALAEELEARSV
jgi:hypothetical protein